MHACMHSCMDSLMAFHGCHRSFSIAEIFLRCTRRSPRQDILSSVQIQQQSFVFAEHYQFPPLKKLERARKLDTSVARLLKAPGCSRLKTFPRSLRCTSPPLSQIHTPISTTKPPSHHIKQALPPSISLIVAFPLLL